MSSRNTASLTASWRSQSQICRWISGSVLRRRSARGGKSPPRSARAGSLLPLLPFLPHQEAVGQHHRHRMPVEASPPSALVLVPAQEPLGLLVVLLHPVPPMRVLHHRLQRHPRPEVAPVIPTLAIGRLLPDQPTETATARRRRPPAADGDEPAAQPTLASFPPRHRAPRPQGLGADQGVSPLFDPAVTARRDSEVGADGHHRALAALLQAVQEVGIVAGVRIGGHAGPAHTPGLGLVEQGQGDLRLGLEGDLLGHMGLGTSGQVFGPVPGQVQPSRDRPAHGTFGIVAVDGDLAVAFLAQGAGVLPGDAHGALALLGEARVIEDQDAVSLAGQSEHLLDTLAVELVLVPSRGGKQALELLFGGAGYARSDGIAVLVGQLGQQPSQVAIQGMSPFAAREMNMERLQERGQLGQWLGGSLRNTNGGLHTPLYARTPKRQSSTRSLSEYLLVLSHGRWISLGFGLFGLGPTLCAHYPPQSTPTLQERRQIFKTLWVKHISCHSADTFSRPRNRNLRIPRADLIMPNTGSTMCLRAA